MAGRPLDGEHDCLRGLVVGPGSIDDDRELGAPGLPLVAESGLSGRVVRKFGGASREKPGISEGFHGLDFVVGEVPREGTGFLDIVEADFAMVEDTAFAGGADTVEPVDVVDGRRVGVAALDAGFGGLTVGRVVGVEDLAVDLDGVDDLAGADCFAAETAGLVEVPAGLVAATEDLAGTVDLLEDKVGREVGVEGLEALEDIVSVGRLVGVAGLDPGPPEDEGRRIPAPEAVDPGEEACCLDVTLVLAGGSTMEFANRDLSTVGRAFGVPS